MLRQAVKVRENAMIKVELNQMEKERKMCQTIQDSRGFLRFSRGSRSTAHYFSIDERDIISRIFLRQSVYESAKTTSALEQRERQPARGATLDLFEYPSDVR